MNKRKRTWVAIGGIAVVVLTGSIYLYLEYLNPESAFLRSGGTPFWTVLENDAREVIMKQGQTRTIPVELHYWKGLRSALGIKFEEPETQHGGLYNPPDGLEISFNLDDAYIQIDNGKIIDILSHRDVKLKEVSQIQQHQEGDMVVAEDVGNITISVGEDVPVGDYLFGIATSDARVNSPYSENSQLLAIKVTKDVRVSCQEHSLCTYQLEVGNSTYPINFRFNGTIESMTADLPTKNLNIKLQPPVRPASLQIAIPREVVDSRAGADGKSGADDDFVVFADQIPTNDDVKEFSTKEGTWAKDLGISDNPEKYRILEIHIEQGTQTVDIVGTWPI